MKKVIAILTILAILVTSVPVVFAENTSTEDTENSTLYYFNDNLLNNDLYGIFDTEYILDGFDTNIYYMQIQGGCSNDEYFYYAFLIRYMDNKTSKIAACRIISCIKNNTNNVCIPVRRATIYCGQNPGEDFYEFHAGDMTYNDKTNELIIAYSANDYHNILIKTSATPFSGQAEILTDADGNIVYKDDKSTTPKYNVSDISITLEEQTVSCKTTAIDYIETTNQYVVGVTGFLHRYAILDSDFNLIEFIEPNTSYSWEDQETTWMRQGIYCDGTYIYSLNVKSYPNNQAAKDDEISNRLLIYSLSDGSYLKSIYLGARKKPAGDTANRFVETENITIKDGFLYIGLHALRNRQDRSIHKINLYDIVRTVKYCPNEQVNLEQSLGTDESVISIFFDGAPAALKRNRFISSGKSFTGWTAYNQNDMAWYYSNGTNGNWFGANDTIPTGYTKHIFSDQEQILGANGTPTSQEYTNLIISGKVILLCAQWQNDTNYYIDYVNTGTGGDAMNTQVVPSGTYPQLTPYAFINEGGGAFLGWNVYCVELNRWLYEKSDGNMVWLEEGTEPVGAKKYIQDEDGPLVVNIAAGLHIELYSAWNEYYIFYNANGKIIKQGFEKGMTKGIRQSGGNIITDYQANCTVDNANFNGWYFYRPYVNSYLYLKDGTSNSFAWYAEDVSGYTRFKSTPGACVLGATAQPGEKLILIADWN